MEILKTIVAVDGRIASVTVPSGSRPEVKHKVTVSCSCEGFQYAGYCYHIKEASDILKEDQTFLRSRTKQRCVLATR